MRVLVLGFFCGLVAGCTSGAIAPPRDRVLYEVPSSPIEPIPRVSEPDDFTSRIEAALADQPAPATTEMPASPSAPVTAGTAGTPIDDDRLNLAEYTLEQQRIDAAIAERELAEARERLVIVQPEATVPQPMTGANIALFAKQTTHAVGEQRYSRGFKPFAPRGNCRRFTSADEAQRAFLAEGGPERDPRNLDPDGDGFACSWDPEPYRRLSL